MTGVSHFLGIRKVGGKGGQEEGCRGVGEKGMQVNTTESREHHKVQKERKQQCVGEISTVLFGAIISLFQSVLMCEYNRL